LQRIQATLVARRHFIERQTKTQIADELALSRFKVARLIDAAIEEGLLRFVITEPDDLDTDLSEQVRKRFGLKSALVLRGPELPTSALTEPLGRVAAQLLEEVLVDGQVLAVAWGRTLSATARTLTHLPRVDVVQTAGTMSLLDHSQSPVELVHQLARLSGGQPYSMYVPMWVEDATLVGRLRSEAEVARVFAQFDRINVLVSGIGSWDPVASGVCETFPPAWRRQMHAAGVCADLCATLLDENGAMLPSPLDRNGLAIDAAQLRKIPEIIGVGGGNEKRRAVAAVLRGHWIHHLVTDAGVALWLLDLPEQGASNARGRPDQARPRPAAAKRRA
jgi:DNA-binding transcriptional regulator LsrR (DeoR family)